MVMLGTADLRQSPTKTNDPNKTNDHLPSVTQARSENLHCLSHSQSQLGSRDLLEN